jgi:hypothetical protein
MTNYRLWLLLLLLPLLLLPTCSWSQASAGELDWGGFMAAKREELTRINKGYTEGLQRCGTLFSFVHKCAAAGCQMKEDDAINNG